MLEADFLSNLNLLISIFKTRCRHTIISRERESRILFDEYSSIPTCHLFVNIELRIVERNAHRVEINGAIDRRRDPALRNVAFVAQTSHEPANFFPPDRSQDPANRGGGSLDRARFYEHGMSQ